MRQSAAFGSEVWLLANRTSRLWQIDCIRGIAVVLMVFYHFMWDVHYFGLYQLIPSFLLYCLGLLQS